MRESTLRCSSALVVVASALSLAVGCGGNVGSEQVASDSARIVSSSSFVPTLGPSDVLSSDSAWYKDVTTSPIASSSKSITSAIRFGGGHPQVDFSIKVMQANAETPKESVQFSPDYTPDSDSTPVPVPNGGALEEEAGYNCSQGGDCHLIVIDPAARKLFELWNVNNTSADGSGTWSAADETVWLMDGHYGSSGRGIGCTSADAAGLSVTAGLIGVREANRGEINHAIRFILPNSVIRKGKAFIAPATHGTSATSAAAGPAYGTRLRLRASFDESSVTSKGGVAVLRALKKYGMILADAGQIAFTAESDELYKAEGLSWSGVLSAQDLSGLSPSDFDVVDYDESSLGSGDDCVRAADPSTTPRTTDSTTPAPSPTPAPTTTTTTPAPAPTPPSSGAPNLITDGVFELGTAGFQVWPGTSGNGDTPTRTTNAISGANSLSTALLDSNWSVSTSIYATGNGALTATAKLRNDAATAADVSFCAGVYDESWSFVRSCTPYTLQPGQVVPVSVTYTIASTMAPQMANIYVSPAGSAPATIAMDEVYAAYASP